MSKSGRRVRIFSALEVANICGVVNQTAINWIRSGHLKAFTTPGGQYRIYAKDLAAFLDKRGMSTSGEVLQVMMENADWNIILIAAEQSANDSLKNDIKRLFPDLVIVQAYNWFDIGRKITEEKPGFLLIDADLSGVDITKFVHTVKDDPTFGKPYVFLLAGNNYLSQEGASIEALQGIADAVFTKPVEIDKLEAVIRGLERHLDIAANA